MESVAAVILSSRRGDFKPLMELAGVTAVERCVETFRAAGVNDVRVVTGHRAEELAPVLDRLGVRGIHNADYKDGMFSSVAAGVATIGEELDAFFIHPVDLPLVRPATVRILLDAFFCEERGGIVYPAFRGERGHPPWSPLGSPPKSPSGAGKVGCEASSAAGRMWRTR